MTLYAVILEILDNPKRELPPLLLDRETELDAVFSAGAAVGELEFREGQSGWIIFKDVRVATEADITAELADHRAIRKEWNVNIEELASADPALSLLPPELARHLPGGEEYDEIEKVAWQEVLKVSMNPPSDSLDYEVRAAHNKAIREAIDKYIATTREAWNKYAVSGGGGDDGPRGSAQ